MTDTLVIHAHPRPTHSVVVRGLLQTLQGQANTSVRSLYTLYPDFDIDVATEQRALAQSRLVVWLAPVYWYSVPALLKHWFDCVLAHGWAYGHGGHALRGKAAWWVCSAGGAAAEYVPGGRHGQVFSDYVAPLEQVARYCGMRWVDPFVVHAGHHVTDVDRARAAQALRERRQALQAELAGHPQAPGEQP